MNILIISSQYIHAKSFIIENIFRLIYNNSDSIYNILMDKNISLKVKNF